MSGIDPEVQRLMDFDCSVLHTEVGPCATEEEEQAKVNALLDERVNEEYEIAMSITRRLNRPTVTREQVMDAVLDAMKSTDHLTHYSRKASNITTAVMALIAPKEEQDAVQ